MKSSREPLDSKSQISVPEIKSEDIRSAVQAAVIVLLFFFDFVDFIDFCFRFGMTE